MYANAYGTEGVTHLIDIMKSEIAGDAAQLGIADIHNICTDSVSFLCSVIILSSPEENMANSC